MIEQVINSVDTNMVMDWAKGNQGAIGIAGWVMFMFYALVRVVRKQFGGDFDWGKVGNTLQVALGSNGWRWGKEDGMPTGKSILLERADGKKLVANFKTGKYFLATKESKVGADGKTKVSYKENDLNHLLTRKQIKKLNNLRDKVVASLKSADEAAAKLNKQRKDDEVVAALNNFTGYRA